MNQKYSHEKNPISLGHRPAIICANEKTSTLKCSYTSKRYYLGNNFPGIYFTRQEARCMVYFLQGLSNQKTAQAIGLSIGTVSCYSINMRRKLLCKRKKDLIEKILNTEFDSNVILFK